MNRQLLIKCLCLIVFAARNANCELGVELFFAAQKQRLQQQQQYQPQRSASQPQTLQNILSSLIDRNKETVKHRRVSGDNNNNDREETADQNDNLDYNRNPEDDIVDKVYRNSKPEPSSAAASRGDDEQTKNEIVERDNLPAQRLESQQSRYEIVSKNNDDSDDALQQRRIDEVTNAEHNQNGAELNLSADDDNVKDNQNAELKPENNKRPADQNRDPELTFTDSFNNDFEDDISTTASSGSTTSIGSTEIVTETSTTPSTTQRIQQRRASGMAQVIAYHVPQEPETLEKVYPLVGGGSSTTVGRDNGISCDPQQDILLYLNFAKEFNLWNPRNRTSEWQWLGSERPDTIEYAADHGRLSVSRSGSSAESNQIVKSDVGYATLESIPFARYWPNSDSRAGTSYGEAYIVKKQSYEIHDNERILFRIKFSCLVDGVERHPFPALLVTTPTDDYRLANCAFQVIDRKSGLFFHFAVTNTGVWALYGRGPTEADDREARQALQFIARRRVGERKSHRDTVDAGIEFDAQQRVVRYYVNGYLVWTVHALGVPPPNGDGMTKVDMGKGVMQVSKLTSLSIGFGTAKCLDESDPNNGNSTMRLVNVQGAGTKSKKANYYADDASFYDKYSLVGNNVWGQSASMKLVKLLVIKVNQSSDITGSHGCYNSISAPLALPTVTDAGNPDKLQARSTARHIAGQSTLQQPSYQKV